MKGIIFTLPMLLALTAPAFASPREDLTSASVVTLKRVGPEVDAAGLTPIQISRINDAVDSDDGLSRADVLIIVRR